MPLHGTEALHTLHLASGGTLDSHWDPVHDTAVPNEATVVPDYLRYVARVGGIASETLFLKDSRKTTVADQDLAADRIAETQYRKIFLTVGTFLLSEIGKVILHHPMTAHHEALDKRVVLVGAGVPMKGCVGSDGGFNLGMTHAVLQQKTVNRHSAVMSGCCFPLAEIRKDLSTAVFSGLEGRDQLGYDECDLITAGGSIDFRPDGLDALVPDTESRIPAYLREAVKTRKRIYAISPFLKDSREVSVQDLELICEMVRKSKTNKIIITTGIYKIRAIQTYLEEHLQGQDKEKTIILTGSRLPITEEGDKTDAPFNLGYACGKLGFLEPGIHIAVRGKILGHDEDVIGEVYYPHEVEILRERGITQ